MHDIQDLIFLFNQCFEKSHNTRLICGEEEPIYLPADETCDYHRVAFAHGFFSSALHECAHWLLAGQARRQQVDYGYWYMPDGRTAEQQLEFQRVEIKPQALEWILSLAARHPFHFSSDNLNGESANWEEFQNAVKAQVQWYQMHELPKRAKKFRLALHNFYA